MRDSLKKSIEDSPVKNQDRWAKGSIVLCQACALPIFKLDRGFSLGSGAGSLASAFKPLTLSDMMVLAQRQDIDAGVRAAILNMTPDMRQSHVQQLREVRAGDPMKCPVCGDCFVQVLATEKHEVLDKSYTLELLTIPPEGEGRPAPVRGKRLGAAKDWVH